MREDFSEQLVKGKIAEIVFEQMFTTAGFKVIPFGYELILRELNEYKDYAGGKELLESIRKAPDFALISHEPEMALLVEVKFRARFNAKEMTEKAHAISTRWKYAWFFLATPTGFYFDACKSIVQNGDLKKLDVGLIHQGLQSKYLSILHQYIQPITRERKKD